MEAWEHIAPELPLGWSVRNEGDETASGSWAEWWDVMTADSHDAICSAGTRDEAVDLAWRNFGPTRKRYAELIAVERVREVAAEKWGGQPDTSAHQSKRFSAFTVSVSGVYIGQSATGRGPTLCEAAWACIQALGGGE